MKHIKLLLTISLLTSYGSVYPSASASAGSSISENASRSHALTVEEERAMHKHLLVAPLTGNLAIVRQYIAAGANVDLANQYGSTALMYAARRNSTEIARLLIDAGADVDLVDQDGSTALMDAAQSNSTEIARLLITAGADPTIQTHSTVTNPSRRFAHELVPKGYTFEDIAKSNALQTELENWYNHYANPLW